MNIKKLQELIELMNSNDLTEVEIEEEGMKIKLKKGGGIADTVPQIVAAVSPKMPEKEEQTASQQPLAKNVVEIKAPMVGTFYRAPAPDSPPYVEIGDTIKKGDVVCILEAMKLMNEVKSEYNGKIVDIMVENAQPIEFGQVLFLVELS